MASDEKSTGRTLSGEKWYSCFLATKHSWKGKYKRIFAIGHECIATFNPTSHEETNRWEFGSELVDIQPGTKAANEFVISTKKKDAKKVSTTTFSCEFREALLTDCQTFRHKFNDDAKGDKAFKAFKSHWSSSRKEVGLRPASAGLEQIDPLLRKVIAVYKYTDIESIYAVSDLPGAFAVLVGGFGRMHVFSLEQRDELLRIIGQKSANLVGKVLNISKKTITREQFLKHRLGDFQDDAAITSLAEFQVQKVSNRHPDPVPRLLCLSEACVLERDPATYNIVCCRPLSTVFCIVRDERDPQLLKIQYLSGDVRSYMSSDRDALLASLLDSVRANGNKNVSVQMAPTHRGRRFQPFNAYPEEEIESHIVKQLCNASSLTSEQFALAIREFNCNVSYSGLVYDVTEDGWFRDNKEKLIVNALAGVLACGDRSKNIAQLAAEFGTIRRLVASKAGYQAFTSLPQCKEKIGTKIIKALRADNDFLTYSALDTLCALMQPMHENYELAQEKANKESLLQSKDFIGKLLSLLKIHAERGTAALCVSALLDFFTFAVCAPYCETTEAAQFDRVLKAISDLGRSLFRLFEHPSMAVVKAAGLIMKSIIEEGDDGMCKKMQELSLAEGALLRHLITALFTESSDNRMLTHRQLSRHLVGLWMEKNAVANELFKRLIPAGLIDALDSEEEVPEKEVDRMHVRDTLAVAKNQKSRKTKLDLLVMHWRARTRRNKEQDDKKPVVLRRRRQLLVIERNWEYFYFQFNQDHARADLIWNFKTREELREAMENELRAFLADKDLRGKYVISWNHVEFEVRYETLAEEVKIGDHYLRLLLEDDPKSLKIHNPTEFFNDLYHRFLLTTKPSMKSMCLQAMAVVYSHCHEVIGNFNDTEFIVHMLNRTEDCEERDRLLQFLDRLLLHKDNAKRFIDADGIKCLVNLVTLAHLDVARATTPLQTTMLEASTSQLENAEELEWYYRDGTEKQGPYGVTKLKSFYDEGVINKETKVWAQGMEGWRQIRLVPQLKWTICSEGQAVLTLTQLSVLCLDMLIKICQYYPSRDSEGAVVRPVPRCKRALSDPICLPHIVQLLLTFQPEIVERVATLLSIIVEDNSILPRLYLTGVFYFIMMYTGSNLLPIARFLQQTHNFQAYKSENVKGSSILATLLPVAMVCFLDNYGPEKFASIFLGEFDTPEAIWGSEMRRLMIEKIALHLADFTPRLKCNTRSIYQFCPIPIVSYPQLENELFCNIYYLRHLCDEEKFPEWDIKNHIELLKDVLEAWKIECEKKPADMSVDEALTVLGLDPGSEIDSKIIRKAYFKMSMKYHPDKNPEGRDMFEKINKAYEFVSSKESLSTSGPNSENIVLILRAQSILFRRYPDILAPYKYAGYPMLVSTIERETKDENLFGSTIRLLECACELAYYTVKSSPLNAEELRREGGIETLAHALSRCISAVSRQTTSDEPAVKVCIHILNCLAAAAQFEECREKVMEVQDIVRDVCRCLWLQGSPELTLSAIDCVCAFSVDSFLQNQLLQGGAMWHLIMLLFGYDYTLDESNIEKDEKTHQQEFVNKHAKIGVKALARMGGFRKNGDDATPENLTIQASLTTLLTPYLAEKLGHEDPIPLLKLFNDNTECPYLIWDNATRAELSDYVENQQEQCIKTGEPDENYGQDLVYTAHKDELIVDNIFVRVYNEQPTFTLRDPQSFATKLIDFIGTKAQYLWSARDLKEKGQPTSPRPDDTADAPLIDFEDPEEKLKKTIKEVQLSLEALRNVITASPGSETMCNGHFNLLFSLLRTEDEKLQYLGLEVLTRVTGNKTCVAHIAKAKVLVYLLFTLRTLPNGRVLALEVLHAVVSNNKCIVELIQSGGLLYLLELFCSATNPAVREGTAALMGKMMAEKLHGPRVRLILIKFLPPLFMEAVRDSPEASVTMYEGNHENPELIWDEDSRSKVSQEITRLRDELFAIQEKEPNHIWALPEDYEVVYENVQGEVVVGGVFLRLVIKQPSWQFRKPKEFLVALMNKFTALCSKSELSPNELKQLETVSLAASAVISVQGELANQLPSIGHLGKLVGCLNRESQPVQTAVILFMSEAAGHQLCIRAFGSFPTVAPLMKAMKVAVSSTLAVSTALVKRLYEHVTPPLVLQAVETRFVQYLLDLLKEGLDNVDNSAACKANIVKALKQMTTDLGNGQAVTEILDKCDWWAAFRDQRHDLFLTNNAAVGYLEGPTAQIAGYLTAAPSSSVATDTAPPEDDIEVTSKSKIGNPDA